MEKTGGVNTQLSNMWKLYQKQRRRCKFCDTILYRGAVVIIKIHGIFILSCGGCQELNEGDFELQEFISLRSEKMVSFFSVRDTIRH